MWEAGCEAGREGSVRTMCGGDQPYLAPAIFRHRTRADDRPRAAFAEAGLISASCGAGCSPVAPHRFGNSILPTLPQICQQIIRFEATPWGYAQGLRYIYPGGQQPPARRG